ncbi:MAG: hypothetical protein COB85_04095 [Bacteroidetes bacterium]|nr:MAG: hypothetical protein COB85_04095 [Bacteroidota bacterium]
MKKSLVFLTMVLFQTAIVYGQGYQWAKSIEGSGKGRAIAVDSIGNVYIKGQFLGTADFDPSPDTANLTAGSSNDIYVAKYNSSGAYLWALNIGAGIDDNTENLGNHYITVDGTGNVYVTGHFTITADFDPGVDTANLTPVGALDIFFAKYDSSGNYQWAKSIGSGGGDHGHSISVDASGNVHITGFFTSTVDFDPDTGTANLTSIGSSDLFFAKYDNNGNYVWAKSIESTLSSMGHHIIVDTSGNCYITGYFDGVADFDPGVGTISFTSVGGPDIFFAKYDSGGNYIYAKNIGNSGNGQGNSITVDETANVHITGYFSDTMDFDPDTGIANLISAGQNDIFFAKYDSSGDYLYANGIGTTSDEQGQSITLDANDNVYVSGSFQGIVDFDPDTGIQSLTSAGAWDFFLAKYNVNGNYLWAISVGNTNNELLHSHVSDSSGNVHITGYFTSSTVDFDPGPDTANLIAVAGDNIFFAKYKDCSLPNSIPISSFTYTQSTYTFNFTDSSQNATSWYWDFGDGSTDTSLNPIHTYQIAGIYNVCLIASNACGSDTLCQNVTISVPQIMFQKTFGGDSTDYAHSIRQTTDGGYIIIGQTISFGAGDWDFYLIKTDANGDTLWTKSYGGDTLDIGYSVQQTIDGGYIIAGETRSFGSGYSDFYVIKTDLDGDTLWTKTYGGSLSSDYGVSIQQTSDGGYIITGNTGAYGAGQNDAYLIRINSMGDTLWTKTYGGTGQDFGNYV